MCSARKDVAQRFQKVFKVCSHVRMRLRAAVTTHMFLLVFIRHPDRLSALWHRETRTSLTIRAATIRHAQGSTNASGTNPSPHKRKLMETDMTGPTRRWVCDALTCCGILVVPLSVWCSSVDRTHALPWPKCRISSCCSLSPQCSGRSLERPCV